MKHSTLPLALSTLLALAVSAQDLRSPAASDPGAALQAAPTRMLRLATGDVLWGTIDGHDPDGIRFLRIDTGGLLVLPWSVLDPGEAGELRLRFGYVETQSEELMIDAEKLALFDGSEFVGVIVNRDETHVWLKNAEGTIPIPKTSLLGTSTLVRVPARDVYSKDELYQQKAFELQDRLILAGARGAAAHDEMAQYCEVLFDYVHALEHYKHASNLDATWETARIAAALERTEEKAAHQEQVDMLAQIDLWRARKRYDLAMEGLAIFPERYPDSPLFEDLNKLRNRVAKYQERDLREEVVRVVHSLASRVARDAAREKNSYESVMAYLDEQMGEDVMKRAQESVQRLAPGIGADEVKRLWTERSGGRLRSASFGLGTWLLGEGRALATYEKEKDGKQEDEEPERGSQGEARKQLEERIARYLRNQELTRKAKSGNSEEGDPVEFWNQWDHAGRYQWILAYFVEFSGLFKIERVSFSNCRECGGTGARDIVYSGSAIAGQASQNVLVPCPTCHTIGRVRRVKYR